MGCHVVSKELENEAIQDNHIKVVATKRWFEILTSCQRAIPTKISRSKEHRFQIRVVVSSFSQGYIFPCSCSPSFNPRRILTWSPASLARRPEVPRGQREAPKSWKSGSWNSRLLALTKPWLLSRLLPLLQTRSIKDLPRSTSTWTCLVTLISREKVGLCIYIV